MLAADQSLRPSAIDRNKMDYRHIDSAFQGSIM